MPKTVIAWYKRWINTFPETWHENDLERFYMFVSKLLSTVKKDRLSYWLKQNLKQDCTKLSDDDISKYCELYDHIKAYDRVWKSQQAKLIAADTVEQDMREVREKYK